MIEPAFLFNPADIAKGLKEVAVDIIQTEHQEVVSRWFHSNRDADLFIWLDESGRIIKQQFSFNGQVVEWNVVEGVRTGYVYEDERGKKPGDMSSEIIRFDSAPQKASIAQAIDILNEMKQLPLNERQTLIAHFTAHATHQGVSYGEFYQRLARPKKSRQTNHFLANLRRRLKKLFS